MSRDDDPLYNVWQSMTSSIISGDERDTRIQEDDVTNGNHSMTLYSKCRELLLIYFGLIGLSQIKLDVSSVWSHLGKWNDILHEQKYPAVQTVTDCNYLSCIPFCYRKVCSYINKVKSIHSDIVMNNFLRFLLTLNFVQSDEYLKVVISTIMDPKWLEIVK